MKLNRYIEEMPWEQLSTPNSNRRKAAATLIKDTGLDWKVGKYPALVDVHGNLLSTGKHAIVREDNKAVLGLAVTDLWTPVQNEEAFGFFDELVARDELVYESAGSFDGGKIVFVMAKAPEPIVVGDGDEIKRYFVLANHHTGRGGLSVMLTPIRIVCKNTLIAAIHNAHRIFTFKHMPKVKERVETAVDILSESNKFFLKIQEHFNQMLLYSIKKDDLVQYAEEIVFGSDEKTKTRQGYVDAIVELYERGKGAMPGTLWGAYNAATEFADHILPALGREKDNIDNQLKSIMYGRAAAYKQRAFDIALSYLN